VDVSGVDLKDEQMIKLPSNIINSGSGDWQSTVNKAHAERESLEEKAIKLNKTDGRYIRPIMVIR
jgi:hypothetical protein